MKNKGRKHKWWFNPEEHCGIGNCKGNLAHITRPIESMGSRSKGHFISKFDKKKWSKRVRGYFKSQTKNIFDLE